MKYTIKAIADLAGVTTRTLRYYDEIGLLEPASIGENGYRYYDYGNLLQLQQIMFYRELDVPVKDIQQSLSRPDFNHLDTLVNHRQHLEQNISRLEQLLDTVDQTIATIKGEWTMTDKEYFLGFDETQYEEETRQRWANTSKYKESQKKWSSYTKSQRDAIKAEGRHLAVRMVTEDPNVFPDNPDIQIAVGEYYNYINTYFYSCNLEFLRSLADMWVEDPRFANDYEGIREGGAAFVREAVHIYCDNHK